MTFCYGSVVSKKNRQEPVSHNQYSETLCESLTKWLKRKSRRLKEQWLDAALTLLGINLDTASTILEPLYSPDPRGQKPFEPVRMFRSLLLMIILGYTRISEWAEELRNKPRLAIISGFVPFDTPATGTFYAFIDRLEDGPYQKPREGYIKPSQLLLRLSV
jgi:hypothetical protein